MNIKGLNFEGVFECLRVYTLEFIILGVVTLLALVVAFVGGYGVLYLAKKWQSGYRPGWIQISLSKGNNNEDDKGDDKVNAPTSNVVCKLASLGCILLLLVIIIMLLRG